MNYDETISRSEIYSRTVLLGFQPEWVPNSDGWPGGHAVYKGKLLGADWSGRIDLWTKNNPLPKEGDIVVFKEMKVLKRVARRKEERQKHRNGRVVVLKKQVPLCESLNITEDERAYFIIEAAPARNPRGILSFTGPFEGWTDPPLQSRRIQGRQRNGENSLFCYLEIENTDKVKNWYLR